MQRWPSRFGIRRLVVGIVILVSVRNSNSEAMPQEIAPEYLIKAAYLYQFLQYVRWPTDSFPSQDSPIVIGILGQDPFGEAIDRVVAGRRVLGRRIEVRRVTLEEASAGCHVVFMAREERALLNRWLRRLRTKPILVVTESPWALSDGATINFVMEKRTLRYEVNLKSAKDSRLEIATPMLVSARRLLGQATIGGEAEADRVSGEDRENR